MIENDAAISTDEAASERSAVTRRIAEGELMVPTTAFRILVRLSPLAALWIPVTVLADFNPVVCPQCDTMTEVAWTYTARGFYPPYLPPELPLDPNCVSYPWAPCQHYANWLTHDRQLSANQYVKKIGFKLDEFGTENGYDFLHFGEINMPPTALTGGVSLGWRDVTLSGSAQATPLRFDFRSDYSVSSIGFAMTRARVCCQSTPVATPTYMTHFARHMGLLLGSNDVVYFTTPTAGQCPEHLTIAMWGDPSGANDFDLYVRCNAPPTQNAYDLRGYSTDTQEFLHIGMGICPYPGTWYVAVHSFEGAGWFNVVAQRHLAGEHRSLRAGTNFNATSQQMAVFKNTLEKGARYFFAATEGTQYIEKIDLYNSQSCATCAGSQCDVCFQQYDNPQNPSFCGTSPVCSSGYVSVYPTCGHNNPRVMPHEWGHRYFCAPDEYQVSAGQAQYLCGHSIMADCVNGANQFNFCYHENDASLQDHGKDGTPGAPPPPGAAVWSIAYSSYRTPWKPASTPDNYSYVDFDFNGLMGFVQQH